MLTNPDINTISREMNQVEKQIKQNKKDGFDTLLFVYYAGHAAVYDQTMCLLNGEQHIYKLEKKLRRIAGLNGSFVISLFDCCH